MKKALVCLLLFISVIAFYSCSKTSFITSKDALVSTSADTLRFDTVFTTTGSVTHSFKIFNQNDQKLNISSVKLMGGPTSFFKMNVDGSPGTTFNNIEVAPNDSIYVFVTVTINPGASNLPFVVNDSVQVSYNGNNHFVQLEAYGQNANFIRSRRITTNTSWDNSLPYVILGGVLVDSNVTLNINKGCRIYAHADAPIIINGTLKVNGEKYDSTRVVFRGDRLDPDYKDFPGSWPGIYFGSSSRDNVLNFAIIKNAYQGIITQSHAAGSNYKVTLNECIIDNIYDAGILSVNSSISARNCLITNCGNNIAIAAGGTFSFNHCTVASYANAFLAHKNPVLFISNMADGQSFALNASFKNSIFYGEGGAIDDEIVIDQKGTIAPTIFFDNILYKNKNDIKPLPSNSINLKDQPPLFDSIDVGKRYFDFHLQLNSPAVNNGAASNVTIDLDGNLRGRLSGLPDIGCYEKH